MQCSAVQASTSKVARQSEPYLALCTPPSFFSFDHQRPSSARNIWPSTLTMPIAPISGTLRKQFFVHLSLALGLGTAGGYAFWYVLLFLGPICLTDHHPSRYAVHLPSGVSNNLVFTCVNSPSDGYCLACSETPGGILLEAGEAEGGEFVVKAVRCCCNTSAKMRPRLT